MCSKSTGRRCMQLDISREQVKTFKLIIDVYKPCSRFPEKDRWRKLTNEEIWYWMVSQVLVVGGSASSNKFWANEQLRQQISFAALKKINEEEELRIRVHQTLRKTGARWAAKELDACMKTKALANNYLFFKQRKSTPKELLEELSGKKGRNKELKRVEVLKEQLSFFKNKSARDFLMNMGMNQYTLALDIRTQNIFKHLQIDFPAAGLLADATEYNETEQVIVGKICKPLGVRPYQFDRILYQHYKQILGNDFYQLKFQF